ncbi:MAG: response regulator transcription factor, partial [Chloroflexota bacterium]
MPAVREALCWAFEDTVDLAVVGQANDGNQVLDQVVALAPDVVILDIELPGRDGYAVAQQLKRLPHPPIIVFLTVHTDSTAQQRCFEVGGDGFVEKGAGWPALIQQIRRLTQTN